MKVTLADETYWLYEYDTHDQLVSGRRYFSDGSPYPGMQFGYEFDDIGNTTNAGFLLPDDNPAWAFVVSNLDLHVTRVWSNKVELMGTAAEAATVTVNDQRCHRAGEHFWIQLPVDNLADSVETNIVVYVVSNDVVASASGTLFVAKASEAVEHEATGAISAESRYSYVWDGYGRIASVTSTNAAPNFKLEFTYYADGQRATKKVSEWTGSEWSVVRRHSYVYDGWNLIWERVTNSTTSTVSTRHYTWGLDLGGRRTGEYGQSAGGIGGLVAITVSSSSTNSTTSTYLPISDHNGNIHHLLDAETKQIVAHYIYSPFGVLIGEYGSAKDECPFRFQSKYYDRETELYNFGYRLYDPASTKWLTHDPLGEEGGLPLNAFCGNDPVGKWDALGLAVRRSLAYIFWQEKFVDPVTYKVMDIWQFIPVIAQDFDADENRWGAEIALMPQPEITAKVQELKAAGKKNVGWGRLPAERIEEFDQSLAQYRSTSFGAAFFQYFVEHDETTVWNIGLKRGSGTPPIYGARTSGLVVSFAEQSLPTLAHEFQHLAEHLSGSPRGPTVVGGHLLDLCDPEDQTRRFQGYATPTESRAVRAQNIIFAHYLMTLFREGKIGADQLTPPRTKYPEEGDVFDPLPRKYWPEGWGTHYAPPQERLRLQELERQKERQAAFRAKHF